MYVPRTKKSAGILNQYKHVFSVSSFTNKVEGGIWLEIPFAWNQAVADELG
jgi:hypothetical protein